MGTPTKEFVDHGHLQRKRWKTKIFKGPKRIPGKKRRNSHNLEIRESMGQWHCSFL
ncbi:hypothetical protein LEP1GSC165_1762 [Leptospira santarosai str. CBC523]|nr:hypothetical protein LEP1GSC165_1762 [Leptospira santarosai str. CBC523]